MLGNKLKQAIESSAYSTEDIAAMIDMSSANLYRLYKKDSFEIKYLQQIAEILKLPISYFFDEEAYHSVSQVGIGNATGNIKNQKNISGSQTGSTSADYNNVTELQQELKACRDDKDQLSKQLFEVQQELIQVLKGRG